MADFFTSDTHFWHKGILKYRKMPENTSIEEHNEHLITQWNSRISNDDTIWHLGDFIFGGITKKRELLIRLHGRIRLVPGNHDDPKHMLKLHEEGLLVLEKPIKYLKVQVDETSHQSVVLCHFPIQSWRDMHHGTWHLHGHSHGSLTSMGRRLDVGVDTRPDFSPYSLDDIKSIMLTRGFIRVDHHEEN